MKVLTFALKVNIGHRSRIGDNAKIELAVYIRKDYYVCAGTEKEKQRNQPEDDICSRQGQS
jgi:hypothetical protein